MEEWPFEDTGIFARLRRKFFGLNAEEQALVWRKVGEMHVQFARENAEEDRLFDSWWKENVHRLPLEDYYESTADLMMSKMKPRGPVKQMPRMQPEHFVEFAAFKKANWSL